MPIYRNYRNREVTIFLNNSVPIKFLPGEHKILTQEGLEKQYASYLQVITPIVKEGKEEKTPPVEKKGLINEVKQPEPNKELTKEPLSETAKKGTRKVIKETPKVNEGYSPWQKEQTLASTGKQGE